MVAIDEMALWCQEQTTKHIFWPMTISQQCSPPYLFHISFLSTYFSHLFSATLHPYLLLFLYFLSIIFSLISSFLCFTFNFSFFFFFYFSFFSYISLLICLSFFSAIFFLSHFFSLLSSPAPFFSYQHCHFISFIYPYFFSPIYPSSLLFFLFFFIYQ